MSLVAFDFDETLSRSDLSVVLGREYSVGHEVRGLVEQGIRGEVDFDQSLRHRLRLLEGMPERDVRRAFDRCKLRNGARELIVDLERAGASVAIITGTFESGVDAVLDAADVTVSHLNANRLVIEDGAITGDVEGPLLGAGKDEALLEIAGKAGIDLDRTVAVGNGATDLPMLRTAETAIGFNPPPLVEQYCDEVVTSMRKLRLYFEQHGML